MFGWRHVFIFLAVVVLPAGICRAEKGATWRVYKASDGLVESFVTAVSVSPRTNVWVRHFDLNALSVLNGYKIKTLLAPPGAGHFRIFESRGGQVWAAYPEGLQELKEGFWKSYPLQEIRQEFQANLLRRARSISLVPIRQGRVLFLLSDRLMEFNNEWPPQPEARVVKPSSETTLGKFSDMAATPDGFVWLAAEKGLARFKSDFKATNALAWQEFIPPPEYQLHEFQHVFADASGVTVIAESFATQKKMVVRFDGSKWAILLPGKFNVRQAWRGFDGATWAITINSLLRLEPGAENFEPHDIGAAEFYDVAVEPGGAFWLATSEGLFRCAPLTWQTASHLPSANAPIRSLFEDNESRLWTATAGSLSVFEDEQTKTYAFPETLEKTFLPGEFAFVMRDGTFLIDADQRLLRFRPKNHTFDYISHPQNLPVKPLGLIPDEGLCVEVFDQSANPTIARLQIFDGETFKNFSLSPPPIAPETELLFLSTAVNGDLWLSTSAGLWLWHDKKWQTFTSDGSSPEVALCLRELGGGKIWAGAREKVCEYDGKNWVVVRAGFDRVNAITPSRDGKIWVASNSGIFRFDKGEWVFNSTDDGLPSTAVTKIYEDRLGKIWAGTTRGLSRHHPEVDPDPPRSTISNRSTTDAGDTTITFLGLDKWKFTPTEQLLFSFRLDGQEWSPFQSFRSASFPELAAGKHYFQVRAMDRNWNIEPNPLPLEFELPLPWYKETRLVFMAIAGIGAALFFAGLAFNRHRRLVRSYAEVEKIVELRTQQLQQANEQLLHSQKMTALGTLAAGIAHDFNNILSIIRGSAQIIETNLQDRDKILTRLERIKTVVEQGSGIVKAMLGFSRPSETPMTSCDANALAAETIKLLGDRFVRGIEVNFEPDENLPNVCASKDFVQQILLNLIFNAADAMNGSGKIILRSRKTTEPPPHLVLAPAAAPTYVTLSVRDFGGGIDPEIMPRIFEPFFTTKAFSSRRGTGLGLSMAYEMAKGMGCGLTVESEAGKGSTFSLLIPITDSGNMKTTTEAKK